MPVYCVYILYSETLDVYYKGYSSNVYQRLLSHLEGHHKFTSQVRDWKLVYVCEFSTKREALIEEKRLKKLNRKSLEKLVSGQNT